MQEIWKTIPGFELWEASNLGRIRRDGNIKTISIRRRHGRINCAYVDVLHPDGEYKNINVGRLILLAFRGVPSEGQLCRHLDDNPENNNLDNLLWGNKSENAHDAYRNGKSARGGNHPLSKLSEDDVRKIRARYVPRKPGNNTNDIANEYGISKGTAFDIVTRKTWRHVE